MIKQILVSGILVVVFNTLFVFSGGLDKLQAMRTQIVPKETIATDVVDVFEFTLEDEVRKKIGQPDKGFEPYMFLQVFPGLAETDFEGVEASVGKYVVRGGVLTYQTDSTKLIHDAVKSIGRIGMQTLLQNVANRIGINLGGEGTITEVMRALTAKG